MNITNFKLVHKVLRDNSDDGNCLKKALEDLSIPEMILAIELEHDYDPKIFFANGMKKLDGNDLKRFMQLKEINETLDNEHKYAFSIAHSNVPALSSGYLFMRRFDHYEIEETNIDNRSEGTCSLHFRRKLLSPHYWFDIKGNNLFSYQADLDLTFFTKILTPFSEDIFMNDIHKESTWTRHSKSQETKSIFESNSLTYQKNFLVLWNKKYQNELILKIDFPSLIKLLYREYLEDTDKVLKVDNELEKSLTAIVNKIFTPNDYCSQNLDYSHSYKLYKLLQQVNNVEIWNKFLQTNSFMKVYSETHDTILNEILNVTQIVGIEKLQGSLIKCMIQFNNIDFLKRNLKFIEMIYYTQKEEISYEIFKSSVVRALDKFHLLNGRDNKFYAQLNKIIDLFKQNSDRALNLKNELKSLLNREDLSVDLRQNYEISDILFCIHEDEIAKEFFLKKNLPLLKEETHVKSLLKLNSLQVLVNILTILDEEIKGNDETIDKICMIIEEYFNSNHKHDTKMLINTLRSTKFCKQQHIKKLLFDKLKYYDEKIKYANEFSWRMPDASVPELPVIEDFLRSNRVSMMFSNHFKYIRDARQFAKNFIGLNENYSVSVKAFGRGTKSKVLICKTKDYYKSIKNLANYNLSVANSIRQTLNLNS